MSFIAFFTFKCTQTKSRSFFVLSFFTLIAISIWYLFLSFSNKFKGITQKKLISVLPCSTQIEMWYENEANEIGELCVLQVPQFSVVESISRTARIRIIQYMRMRSVCVCLLLRKFVDCAIFVVCFPAVYNFGFFECLNLYSKSTSASDTEAKILPTTKVCNVPNTELMHIVFTRIGGDELCILLERIEFLYIYKVS